MASVDQFIPIWEWPHKDLYNCSLIHAPGQWWTDNYGVKQPVFGWYSIIYGTICEFVYIPCAIALYKQTRSTCYQIMFWLAMVDILALFANSLSFGYILINGFVYCSHPVFVVIIGLISLCVWCAASIGCLLLVTNRMFDLLRMHHVFEGRTRYFLFLATLYGLYFALFTPPVLANSKHMAMFFDPFIRDSSPDVFTNYFHTANNLLIVTASSLLYVCLCIMLVFKTRAHMTATERKSMRTSIPVFIQSSLICCFNVVASLVYVYMNFVTVSPVLIVVGQVTWQLSHGAPPFIYLTLNKTIRGSVRRLIFGGTNNKVTSSTTNKTTNKTSRSANSIRHFDF